MNILVIGNGFDLAHGLPTRYTDFLKFCKIVKRMYRIYNNKENEKFEDLWKELNIRNDNKKRMKKKFRSIFSGRKVSSFELPQEPISYTVSINTLYDELYKCIYKNIWVKYFENKLMDQKVGWIDFEGEISRVVQSIDNDIRSNELNEEMIITKLSNTYFAERFLDDSYEEEERVEEEVKRKIKESEKNEGRKWHLNEKIDYLQIYFKDYLKGHSKTSITYKQLIQKLEDDLNRLLRALEIYLVDYVENIKCDKLSADIQDYHFDAILSFNYTHTYKKLYDPNENCKYNYIHGETNSVGTIQTNNMVLGIDEYLSDERKNREIDFIVLKKYYQRIYKGTGNGYKKWLEQIQNNYLAYIETKNRYMEKVKQSREAGNVRGESDWLKTIRELEEKNEVNNIFIFGHSLDETDKDILRDLILCDNVYTTIYYHKTYDENGKDDNGRKDLGSKITNLVKVIGQDELIRRTGGSTKTIEFKLQQDMGERV